MKKELTEQEKREFEKVFAPPAEEEFYKSIKAELSRNTIQPQKDLWRRQKIQGCKPFEPFNEDWWINADGDMNGWGYYLISSNRLAEDDWLIHLMSKRMFDANTFLPAYIEACRRAGVQNVTMKMFY